MKLYSGTVMEPMEWIVEIATIRDGTPYNAIFDPRPSQSVINHSPDGFAWGYSGSGPAQLALAILIDHFKHTGRVYPVELAKRFYQQFKDIAIATIPKDEGWSMNSMQVEGWLMKIPEYKDSKA